MLLAAASGIFDSTLVTFALPIFARLPAVPKSMRHDTPSPIVSRDDGFAGARSVARLAPIAHSDRSRNHLAQSRLVHPKALW